MTIPESQLKTWSNQGAVTTARVTHESVRSAINGKDFDIYLQGSYKNSTNIRGDSDVDIIVQLNSTFEYDIYSLTEYEKRLFKQAYKDAVYLWKNFRDDIIKALQNHYGISKISEGNKSIKVAGDSWRLPADVIVCLQYRKYQSFRSIYDQKYIEGILFYTIRENRRVINFPKPHYDNGVNKNAQYRTNGWYKPTVRVFKNARTYLIDKGIISETLAPSYFLECLLYNVPDENFKNSYKEIFLNLILWLGNCFQNDRYQKFLCQNEQLYLFGNTPEQWSSINALKLIISLFKLWGDW